MPQYAQPYPDLVPRYDVRRVCQFAGQTGQPYMSAQGQPLFNFDPNFPTQLGIATLNSCVTLITFITDASNEILMACRVANRYLQSDLDNLYASYVYNLQQRAAGNSYSINSALPNLVCDLCYGKLVSSRGLTLEQVESQAPLFKYAKEVCELLKRGERVFDDNPSVPGTDAPSAGVTAKPTQLTYPYIDLWVNQTDNRLFPPGFCGPR